MSAYLTDSITIIKYMGVTDYNEPIDTENIGVIGRVEYKTTLLSDLKGQEVVAGKAGMVSASAIVLLPESIDISLERALRHEDRLKFDDVEHAILKIEQPKAFSTYFVFKYRVYVA